MSNNSEQQQNKPISSNLINVPAQADMPIVNGKPMQVQLPVIDEDEAEDVFIDKNSGMLNYTCNTFSHSL